MTETDERLAFRDSVMTLVQDLRTLCKFVLDRPGMPVPSIDRFGSTTCWVTVSSPAEFDRVADLLARDGIVEHESHERFRSVRRRFGYAVLEVQMSLPGPFDQDAATAVVEGEVS